MQVIKHVIVAQSKYEARQNNTPAWPPEILAVHKIIKAVAQGKVVGLGSALLKGLGGIHVSRHVTGRRS
jgi:hypothetical protein